MAQSALRDSSSPRVLLPLWIRLHERRKTVVVLVSANNTVLDVKDKINETENILQEQQCLLCDTAGSENGLKSLWTMPAQLGATCHDWSRVAPVTILSNWSRVAQSLSP